MPFSVICFIFLHPPTEQEQIDRQNRDCVDLDKQNHFYDKYKVPLTCIIIAYGLITSYRNFRDYYALELWQELLSNNFDPNVYSISEIIVSVVVTGLYCAIIFIKSERNSFFTLLGLMLLSGFLITLTTIIYQFNHYAPTIWIIAVGISVYIGYVPPGALLYDKLMGATGVSMTSVNTIYISEFTATSTTLLVILLKITAFNTMSYVNYFIWLSYFVGVIVSILITISFISFWRLIR